MKQHIKMKHGELNGDKADFLKRRKRQKKTENQSLNPEGTQENQNERETPENGGLSSKD